jgi:predicted deacylase
MLGVRYKQFFNEVLQNIDLEKVSVLIVHSLNPWGFKHNRRGTQNNINLNRNFSLSSKLFRIKNENYLKIKNQLEVREPVTTTFNYPSANLAWQMLTKKNVNFDSLTEAVGRGQYTSPTGINYGGSDFEQQVKSMISLFKEVTPKFKYIFHIDLHTGLGDNGVLHIMTNDEMNQISKKNLKKIFLEERDSDNYELTNSSTHGFYKIFGDYAAIISLINPEPEKVIIGITAEFGTVGRGLFGKLTTANRLIRENQGHFSGYKSKKVEKAVKKDYLELFNPSNESWKKNVLRKGRYLLKTIIPRFINLETDNS